MPKAGQIAIPLSQHHCRALAWWLECRYLPFILRLKATLPQDQRAFQIRMAANLAPKIAKMGRRASKGADQEPGPLRTFSRDEASWLAAQVDASALGLAPSLTPAGTEEGSDFQQIASLSPQLAKEILLSHGAHEALLRFREKVFSRQVGRKRQSRTMESVRKQSVGNAAAGGDERYERRLRQRAREDEASQQIKEEFERQMDALMKRERG